MTMWKKQILARAIRIQKEIGGSHAFFRDNNTELKFGKKMTYIFLYFKAFLKLWLLDYL